MVIGGDIKEYQILLDPARMKYYNIGLDEVLPVVENNEWKPCHTNGDMGKRRPGTLGDSHRQPARPTAKRPCLYRHNADSEFPTWLIRHGLAIPTGRTMQSGFLSLIHI